VRKVRPDPVQHGPALSISIDVFVASSRKRGRVIRDLCDEQNQQRQDRYRNNQFYQGKGMRYGMGAGAINSFIEHG